MFYPVTGATALHRAAQRGDEAEVQNLLDQVRAAARFFAIFGCKVALHVCSCCSATGSCCCSQRTAISGRCVRLWR